MRKLFLLTSFSVAAPFLLIFSLVFMSYISFQQNQAKGILTFSPVKDHVAYAALPDAQFGITDEVVGEKARLETIRQFLARYDSPLVPYAQFIIDKADEYGIDFRLIPAIAMQESNLCKKAPADSHNCWGFGIYGGKITRFEDYPAGIEAVTKTLAKEYKEKHGLVTPEEIMTKYTPGSTSWADSVLHFINKLQ